MTSDGTYSYTYDAWDRLVRVNDLSGGALVATYTFDGENRRVTDTLANGTATDFYYNQSWQIVEERQTVSGQSSPSVTQYVWDLSYIDMPVVSFCDPTGSGTYAATYYTTDANHDVTATIDPTTGAATAHYVYSAYGSATVYSSTWAILGAPTTSGPLYCGYFYDAETGNYLSRNRFYSVTYATWISRDPIRADINLYRYCHNNPVNATDPSGLVDLSQFTDGQLEDAITILEGGTAVAANMAVTGQPPAQAGGKIVGTPTGGSKNPVLNAFEKSWWWTSWALFDHFSTQTMGRCKGWVHGENYNFYQLWGAVEAQRHVDVINAIKNELIRRHEGDLPVKGSARPVPYPK